MPWRMLSPLFCFTTQQIKFFIKDFFSKCDQIRSFLKKSLMENFFFVQGLLFFK